MNDNEAIKFVNDSLMEADFLDPDEFGQVLRQGTFTLVQAVRNNLSDTPLEVQLAIIGLLPMIASAMKRFGIDLPPLVQ